MTAALLPTNADWYLMRASGFVAFVLLTASVALGVGNYARLAKGPWTRTVATLVHRNAALLAVVFVVIHVLTAINDKYVQIPILSILVPGESRYDPFWIGLGATAVDLLIAVVVTSMLRARLRYRSWQVVHWLAYASWPVAFVHSLGAGAGKGADTGRLWATAIDLGCALVFALAVASRLRRRGEPSRSHTPAPRYPTTRPQRPRRPAAGIRS